MGSRPWWSPLLHEGFQIVVHGASAHHTAAAAAIAAAAAAAAFSIPI
jgi:hypothetical protein